jgi:hypothetical protein
MLKRYEITHASLTVKADVVAWCIDQALGLARHDDPCWDRASAGDVACLGFAQDEREPSIRFVSLGNEYLGYC